jgi:hypothetical protein
MLRFIRVKRIMDPTQPEYRRVVLDAAVNVDNIIDVLDSKVTHHDQYGISEEWHGVLVYLAAANRRMYVDESFDTFMSRLDAVSGRRMSDSKRNLRAVRIRDDTGQ